MSWRDKTYTLLGLTVLVEIPAPFELLQGNCKLPDPCILPWHWTPKHQLKLHLWCLIVVIHESWSAPLPSDWECNWRKGKNRPELSKMTGKAPEKYISNLPKSCDMCISSVNSCHCIQKQLLEKRAGEAHCLPRCYYCVRPWCPLIDGFAKPCTLCNVHNFPCGK